MPGVYARALLHAAQSGGRQPEEKIRIAARVPIFFLVNGEHNEAAEALLLARNRKRAMHFDDPDYGSDYIQESQRKAEFLRMHGPKIAETLVKVGQEIDRNLTAEEREALFNEKSSVHESLPGIIPSLLVEQAWSKVFASSSFIDQERKELETALGLPGKHGNSLVHALILKGVIRRA